MRARRGSPIRGSRPRARNRPNFCASATRPLVANRVVVAIIPYHPNESLIFRAFAPLAPPDSNHVTAKVSKAAPELEFVTRKNRRKTPRALMPECILSDNRRRNTVKSEKGRSCSPRTGRAMCLKRNRTTRHASTYCGECFLPKCPAMPSGEIDLISDPARNVIQRQL
jgi:hypothetical protein